MRSSRYLDSVNHYYSQAFTFLFLIFTFKQILFILSIHAYYVLCVHLQNLPTRCVSFSLKLQRTWLMFLAWRKPLPLTTTWKLSETRKEHKQHHQKLEVTRKVMLKHMLSVERAHLWKNVSSIPARFKRNFPGCSVLVRAGSHFFFLWSAQLEQ